MVVFPDGFGDFGDFGDFVVGCSLGVVVKRRVTVPSRVRREAGKGGVEAPPPLGGGEGWMEECNFIEFCHLLLPHQQMLQQQQQQQQQHSVVKCLPPWRWAGR